MSIQTNALINNTQLIHNIPADPLTGAISTPIYQTATFIQDAPGVNKGYDYGRSNNPTRTVLEQLVAKLENARFGYAFATGLAAIDALLKTLSYGDEIIAVDDIYGGAFRLFTHVYQKFGIKVHYVDTTDADNILPFLNENTKLIWIETPTNPTLKITNIKAVVELTKASKALVVVDNTFASPVAQQPITLGADIVIHSGTKYLGGHSDLVAGLIITDNEVIAEQIKFIQNASGGILGPQDCWLLIRGIETLKVRYIEQCKNANLLAQFLLSHPAVDKIYYPGLNDHKNHDVAAQQQNKLFGGIVTFTLKDNTIDAANSVITATKYFKLAESLGGIKSLLCSPPQMTHKSIPREKRLAARVEDSLIRISCGIEEFEDLKQDLAQALSKIQTTAKIEETAAVLSL